MTRPNDAPSAPEPLPIRQAQTAGGDKGVGDDGQAVRAGHLYVVATPIGNLGDLSPRARAVLAGVDRIAAEDTRTSGVMLAHFGIATRLIALHDHNEDRLAASLVEDLRGGTSLALISDAGTPLVSDPGFALVRAARAAGLPVIAVPGPCAAIAALSISGLACDSFSFIGFLPPKSAARRRRLEALRGDARTLIFYESAHRIGECLDDFLEVFGGARRLCLAREISKRFEESRTAAIAEVRDWFRADSNRERGEFVLVLEAEDTRDSEDSGEAERVLGLLMRELSPSAAVRVAAEITGAPRKLLYAAALRLANPTDDSTDADADAAPPTTG